MNRLPATEAAGDPQEAGSLARELAAVLKLEVESIQAGYRVSGPDALAKTQEPVPHYMVSVLNGPADQVTWRGLHRLAQDDPEQAARRWEEVKLAALNELRSSHRAAIAMEGYGSHCWTRARFLAVRSDLMEEWQPRNGIERQLIDMMAQAQTAQMYWLDMLTLRCGSNSIHRDGGRWQAPTVEDAEAMEQAAAMVERFHGMFLRTLKALRDLRRQVPGVVVQNAGQVNVGDKQVNINAGKG
jgi:hypothetical protein